MNFQRIVFFWIRNGIDRGRLNKEQEDKKIQEIGRLKPSGKSGDGYPGVKYKVKKANGKYTTKSFELHSPHKGGDHNFWHWQQNTWSEYNGVSRISSKKALHWRIWGKRVS